MPINFAVAKCTLPVAGDVCFKLTGLKPFYVTSQPVYIWPGTSPYQAIAHAGIASVLSVRDPAEYILPALDTVRSDRDGSAGPQRRRLFQHSAAAYFDVAGAVQPAGS